MIENKGLITLCVVSLAFLFHLPFFILPRVFPRVLHTNMLVSKMREKTQEKREKTQKKNKNSPTRDNVSILHYALGKNVSQLRFGRILVAFRSRFGRVLVAFWSRFGHKHCQNANPTHSVIRPKEFWHDFLLYKADFFYI